MGMVPHCARIKHARIFLCLAAYRKRSTRRNGFRLELNDIADINKVKKKNYQRLFMVAYGTPKGQ